MKIFKRIFLAFFILFLICFALLSIVAYNQAYYFTHFNTEGIPKPSEPKNLTWDEKLYLLWHGVEIPKPILDKQPNANFETIILPGQPPIEAWWIECPLRKAKGTVILFHGYLGCKSRLLAQSQIFRELGYHTLLVDFNGHGGSEGNQTTLGYFESQDVLLAYRWAEMKNPNHCIFLFGVSMGAAAIMKAVHDYKLSPSGILLECPFGSLLYAVSNRFKPYNIPTFPLAQMLVFYGGIQNSFDGFSHQPIAYARKITCPVLLMYGTQDTNVTWEETQSIYNNLKGKKKLVLFKESGHESYLHQEREKWIMTIIGFLKQYQVNGNT